MLLKQNSQKALMGILLFTGLLTLLASCSNSSGIESLVSADPKLKAGTVEKKSSAIKPDEAQKASELDQDIISSPEETQNNNDVNDVLEADTPIQSIDLPENFPASFPLYPEAQLQEVKSGENAASGMLIWETPDNREAIADYYQAELVANDWEIIKPFDLETKQETARAIAKKNQLKVDLTLFPSLTNQEKDSNSTKFTVVYEPLNQDVVEEESAISSATDSTRKPQQAESQSQSNQQLPSNLNQQQEQNEPRLKPKMPADDYLDTLNADFVDLDEVPEQLRQPLAEVAALGILTPYTGNGNVELSKFAPNQIITREEYARWLIAANNRYYDDNPGKKIYIASNTEQPAFQDIRVNNPDFGAIQGLAEAGLIPSRLTEDSTNLLFRPEAPLTREDLITWKVPLDMRQALPDASIQAIKESWGFQDAANINSKAIRALYADFQNGDLSNIRRIFGYTTLFQSKKSVTRAEAAASLWYFGFQGDGVTAREILESEPDNQPLTTN